MSYFLLKADLSQCSRTHLTSIFKGGIAAIFRNRACQLMEEPLTGLLLNAS